MNKNTSIYVKNMVCDRCIRVVREELEKLGLQPVRVALGEVELVQFDKGLLLDTIRRVLQKNGFDLVEDKKARIIEEIKNTVIHLIHQEAEVEPMNMNYSHYLSQQLGMDYHYLSGLFSSVENITIGHYIILQKIERAKELLKYNEYTLNEIAYKLDYSSVQHLSNQFKKVTGMSATQFRKMTINIRKPLDRLI